MGRIIGVLEANGVYPPQDLRRQIISLDDQLAAMENEITSLKAENLKLKADNEPLQRTIDGLKKKLELKEGLHLSEDETLILSYLCHEQAPKFSAQIATDVGKTRYRVEHFLNSLIERALVRTGEHWQGGVIYSPSDDGKTYGVEQGWI